MGTSHEHLGEGPRLREQQGQSVISGDVPVHLKTGKERSVVGAEWGGGRERCGYACGGGEQEVRKLVVLMFQC